MCGIVASYRARASHDQKQCEQAVAALKHRGPDETAVWIKEKIFLGHTRLSIVSPEDGKQPYYCSETGVHAVLNGELYDHLRIKEELRAKGYTFKTKADGEILLGLYNEHGPDFVRDLKGEFAFVLWDSKKQRLFAARDHMGVKPLFYSIRGGDLFLASEIKALLAFDLPRRWNASYVHYANHGISHPEQTCFDGIFALLPGHYLLADTNTTTIRQYWSLKLSDRSSISEKASDAADLSDADKAADFAQAKSMLRALFQNAVAKRLQADVPLACYLSGGLDSTSVLAMTKAINGKALPSFSISFGEDPRFDEIDIARATAHYLGSEHHEVIISDRDIADNLSDALWHGESLITNAHGVALYLLSRAVRQHGFKAILNGNGADELLGGYVFFKEDLLRGTDNTLYDAELAALRHSPIGAGIVAPAESNAGAASLARAALLPHSGAKSTDRLLSTYPSALLHIYLQRAVAFRVLYRSSFSAPEPGAAAVQFLEQFQLPQRSGYPMGDSASARQSAATLSSQLFIHGTLQAYILGTIGDHCEMAHSIEGRVPFLDQDLVSYCQEIPFCYKLKGFSEKHVLREAVRDILPPAIYQRRKQPFAAPPANKYLTTLMNDVFNSASLAHSPFYDQKKVLAALASLTQQNERERIALDSRLLEVLSVCLVGERFQLSAPF